MGTLDPETNARMDRQYEKWRESKAGKAAASAGRALAERSAERDTTRADNTDDMYARERDRLAKAIHKAVNSSRISGSVPYSVGDAERAAAAVVTQGWTPPAGYGDGTP